MRAAVLVLLSLAVAVPGFGGSGAPYPLHRRVTATVFWIGEPRGHGSSENNAVSAWDDLWRAHYGGLDDPGPRIAVNGWFPTGFTPKENPFYVDLPYDDFDDLGRPKSDRGSVVPWARRYEAELRSFARRGDPFSLLKNRWLRISRRGRVCYAQWEDSGPYRYDDAAYVFGMDDRRPRNRRARRAGMDVSPAVRSCLGFDGLNTDSNVVDWLFVEAEQVPDGPWKRVITTRQVYWR